MPTRKQQAEQDDRQRKRVRRVILQHVKEMNARPFADAMARLRAIRPDEWKAAVEQDALATQAVKKGPGRGWWGPEKGGTHGKTLGKIPGHVWERAAQRTGYKAVREAVRTLRQNPVLPPSRDQQWHMPLKVGGQLRGYLVGSDSYAQTVLGASMVPKAGSAEIVVQAEKGKGPGRGWWGPPKGTHGGGPRLTMDDATASKVKYQIEKLFKIPERHANGLAEITTEPASSRKDWVNPKGQPINGCYVHATSTVHLKPGSGVSTLIHEIGHHVTRNALADRETRMSVEGMVRSLKGMTDRELAVKFGLRRYSTTSTSEFLADAYKVRWGGSRSKWEALETFAFDNLVELEVLVGGG